MKPPALPLLFSSILLPTAIATYPPPPPPPPPAGSTLDPSCINLKDAKSTFEIAVKGSPMFHFANYQNKYPSCYPAWPFRPDGSKRPPAALQCWPHATTCNQPGKKGWGGNMPVFYTTKSCPNKKTGVPEIRVSYSVFWERDGFLDAASGHDYDWETVLVIWRPLPSSGLYTKSHILLSGRGKFRGKSWSDIPDTVSPSNWQECGGKGKDHAKVYVGWCEHAMFFDKGGSAAKQHCDAFNDYRSDDWYFVANTKDTLINANPGTKAYAEFCGNDWGYAAMKPSVVYDKLCDYEVNM